MKVGLGEYPGTPRRVFNQSRLTTWINCHNQHDLVYNKNLAPDADTPLPLVLGSWWHDCVQAFFDTDLAAASALNDQRLGDLVDERPDNEGAFVKFHTWTACALPIYEAEYGHEHNPFGDVLATEQRFWVEFATGDVALGTFDALGRKHGILTVGEHKTVAAGTEFGTYMLMRRSHPQTTLYREAALGLTNDSAFREEYGVEAGKVMVVHDLARKDPWPVKGSKNGTVEERREQWASGLLHLDTTVHERYENREQWSEFLDVMYHYLYMSHYRDKNLRACLWPSGSKACPVFDACHHGVTEGYSERKPDYVDLARKANQ